MDNKEVESLVRYRLEQSKENFEEAEALFNINKYKGASNRAILLNFSCNKSNLSIGTSRF